ncbi:MAG: hypothetical protein Q7R83_04135 [bacterium]|nr:hypothetical protein [bacterium]
MTKSHLSPKWESAADLSRRAMDGDADALIRLSRLANQAQDDDDIELYVDRFDRAAILYAMGRINDEADEWQEFRQVIQFFEDVGGFRRDLANFRNNKRRFVFELAVLKEAAATAESDILRKQFSESQEISAFAIQFVDEDMQQTEAKLSRAEFILKIAKKKLAHPRFTSLPDDILDELIESVGYELEDLEDDDDDDEGRGDMGESEDLDDYPVRAPSIN